LRSAVSELSDGFARYVDLTFPCSVYGNRQITYGRRGHFAQMYLLSAADCVDRVADLAFVTGRAKRAIEDHFDGNPELENVLASQGKDDLLAQLRNIIPRHVNCIFVRQAQALGLGHAILCAEPAVGDEPFAVLLPDDLMAGRPGPTKDLVQHFYATEKSCFSVARVAKEDVHRYGIIKPVSNASGGFVQISGIVEKPGPDGAPSDLAAIGRYVFNPEIFDHLKTQSAGVGG